jgi:hypothetical protein
MFEHWGKELFCFLIMLVPVWWFNIGIGMKWKLLFTLGAAIGVLLFFEGGLELRKR